MTPHSSHLPTLKVRDLGLYQGGRWLFRELTLTVNPGHFLALVGPSGVGKSSLLLCLAGLIQPTEGTIYYENGSKQAPASFQPQIGILFQDLRLNEYQTVLDNVLCGRLYTLHFLRTLFGFPSALRKEAFRILYDLGLGLYPYRWAYKISGGEKQRVALARTLFQKPSVLLADEPVAQLDAYLTGRVMGILKQQSVEHKKTVCCVLHRHDLVQRFADTVLSLNPEHPEKWERRPV